MNVEPNDLLLFARVVDEGSFSRAAQRVGLPKSTVSRRIAALENQLGERLLLRTTRQLTVTDFGHGVLGHARQVADEVEAAAALAQQRQAEPSGRLRVSMPNDFANVVLGALSVKMSLALNVTPPNTQLAPPLNLVTATSPSSFDGVSVSTKRTVQSDCVPVTSARR